MIFNTVEECNKIKNFAIPKNGEDFERLEKELLNFTRGGAPFHRSGGK